MRRISAIAVAVLIVVCPGLGAADSLGICQTWQQRRGRTDAERNCISNIRPESFRPAPAADELRRLIAEMRRLQLTGTALRDEQSALQPDPVPPRDAALHD